MRNCKYLVNVALTFDILLLFQMLLVATNKNKWTNDELYTEYLRFFVLLTKMLRDPYHGPRLKDQLKTRFSSAW
jgi:hypothetical protein